MNGTKGKKILLVDDDEALRQSLGEHLRLHEELTTIEADNGADALSLAKVEYFDAILLDVGLPDMDGREVCRLMRRNGVKSPVIMLTAAETDADTILGLDAGAIERCHGPLGYRNSANTAGTVVGAIGLRSRAKSMGMRGRSLLPKIRRSTKKTKPDVKSSWVP